MIRAAAALALFAALAAPTRAAGPFDDKVAAWTAKGYSVKERLDDKIGGLPVAVIVYSGADGDHLEAYVALKGKSYLGYLNPGSGQTLSLEPSPAGRGWKDLLGDGSRAFAYRASQGALESNALEIVRYERFKFRRVAVVPEGKFLVDDGKTLVETRDLPLGRFLSVGCEGFGTISRSAFRTRFLAAKKGALVDATADHPAPLEAQVAASEKRLEALKSDLQKNAGEYLGLAISVYYDEAALGRAREGWDKQKKFFELPGLAPSAAKTCFDAMRRDLRERLGVPPDWP